MILFVSRNNICYFKILTERSKRMFKKSSIIVYLFILFIFCSINVQAEEPIDIANHWAQDYILTLVNTEIMEVYPDGQFRPEETISRGEFTAALAKAMNLTPGAENNFSDLSTYPEQKYINALAEKNIINGYPDGTFKPKKNITRAEIVTVLLKGLGIKGDEETIDFTDYEPFSDIPREHWAINNIKIAEKLGIVDNNEENKFYPDSPSTRATAAKYICKFRQMSGATGYLTDVYPTSNKVSINLLNGERKIYNFNEDSLIGRNNRLVEIDDIIDTDKVFIIADENGTLNYIKAYGIVTEEDLATEVSKMTAGLIEPEEIKQLSEGDLNILQPKLYTAVQNQLREEGLSEDEITAIMNTEWNKLEELSKSRLSETIAIQTGLPLDITRSIMEADWDKIKTYAQIEIVQRMVQRLLASELIS